MLANYLIGLREGLEAALVVGILVAYLVRCGHQRQLRALWLGVGAAIGLSFAAGALLTFTSRSMSFKAQETFGGVMSVLAVGFVTWMIFWMRRAARNLKGELHGKLDAALAVGSFAMVVTAFVAVAREGLETALFVWTAVQATGSSASPIVGAILGLSSAVVLGYLFYRRSVKLNLATFFRYTGAGLVVVAAGVLAYGFHDFQEAGYFHGAGMHRVLLDATGVLPPSSWWGTLFKGMFSISAAPTRLEAGVWLAYLVPTMYLFLRPFRDKAGHGSVAHAAQSGQVGRSNQSGQGSRSTQPGPVGQSRRVADAVRPPAPAAPRRRHQHLVATITGVAGLVLAGCSNTAGAGAIAVTATDSACKVARTTLTAGKLTFEVTNDGKKVTEVYVYGAGDRVVGERENIGPGTKATLSADLAEGMYEVACKPGQQGAGIRQHITVTGKGGAATPTADRSVALDATDFAFAGLDGLTVAKGETIKLVMANKGQLEHELEVLRPAGTVLGEIGPTPAGITGKATLTFDQPGSYRFRCGIDDHEALGMAGTLTVS